MRDLSYDVSRESRCPSRNHRLRRLRAPLLFMALSVVPGLVSFRVYQSILEAAVVTILTAASIGAAAVLFRPR
ncbi:hypothetical protein M2284_005315 [Rhodococcus sp. LBL1]|nr:hypothetical protein [Rhodococcus sp. LBL1]MDH6683031.1 hypothetical protein [Rhodococcus sp. LBL2]